MGTVPYILPSFDQAMVIMIIILYLDFISYSKKLRLIVVYCIIDVSNDNYVGLNIKEAIDIFTIRRSNCEGIYKGAIRGQSKSDSKKGTQNNDTAYFSDSNKKASKKKFGLFKSIRSKLICGFMVTIIPIIMLGLISYNNSFNSIKNTATKASFETLKQLGKNIEFELGKYEEISFQLILNDSLQEYLVLDSANITLDYMEVQQKVQSLVKNYMFTNPNIYNITLLLKDNKTIDFSSNYLIGDVYKNMVDSNLMAKAREFSGKETWIGNHGEMRELSGKAFWVDIHGELDEHRLENTIDYGLSLVRQINDILFSEERGLLIIDLKIDLIKSLLEEINLGDNSELHLVSPDNRDVAFEILEGSSMLIDTNDVNNNITDKEFFSRITDTDGTFIDKYKNQEYLVIHTKIETKNGDTGYTLVGLVPTANFKAEARSIGTVTIIFTLIAIVIALVIGLYLSIGISKPINRILNLSKKVASGDLTVKVDVISKDEMGVLSDSINSMVESMRRLISNAAETANTVEVSASTQEQLSAIEELASYAKHLDETAKNLSDSIKSFKIN